MKIVHDRSEPLNHEEADGAGLKGLLEGYERSLILAALGAVGGRQRSAARLLGILPTTFHEKMKRLGIRTHRVGTGVAGSPEVVAALLHWKGNVPPGGTLELRGLNGSVRIEASEDDEIEVSATRRGPRSSLQAVEVKVVEHSRGVSVCALCPPPESAALQPFDQRTSRLVAGVRVDLVARVPPGIHVVASTVNDDVEVLGLTSNVEARTANGQVRFLPFGGQPSEPAAAEPKSEAAP